MVRFTDIDEMAAAKLADLAARDLRRDLVDTCAAEGSSGPHVVRDGVSMISFCSNDYLGLAQDKRLAAAAQTAIETFGTGAGASRLVAGELPLNWQLEQALAAHKGLPAARVFGSGYLANIGTIPVLAGPGDVIVMDELAHSCMHAGARLSGADVRLFAHNQADAAARCLVDRDDFRHALVLTETIFSMDGDAAPLAALGDVAETTQSWLMSDDAHGLGDSGDNPAIVQMGTLSKSAGSYGGYVCGPGHFIDLLTSRARSFVYTTGLPPAVLAASLAAIGIIEAEPWRAEKAREHAAHFAAAFSLPAPDAAIVPLIVGDAQTALALSAHLAQQGFLVPAIRPPTVPVGTARLRVTFSATHKSDNVDALIRAIKNAPFEIAQAGAHKS